MNSDTKQHLLSDEQIKKILIESNYLSESDLEGSEIYQEEGYDNLAGYLVGKNILSEDLLGQAVAESFGVLYADLNSNVPSEELIFKIPKEIAFEFRVILIKEDGNKLFVASDNPQKKGLKEALANVFPKAKITRLYALPDDIDSMLVYYRPHLNVIIENLLKRSKSNAPAALSAIFDDALTLGTSDIHFEPQVDKVIVRFRVDGLLRVVVTLPHELYNNMLNLVKVKSQLRIDDHFSAQDGSMQYENEKGGVDMRISIVPVANGEKIVIRVLNKYVRRLAFSDLGMSPKDQAILERAARKPFGMILVVGPTGSGKTTTLYSLIKMLNRPNVNITTIEDPVEYKIGNVNQIQVNTTRDLTFAKGLRSIVRQDPDIILVGEIRDRETAEIAVNAALTGHLVLSTFHANDAATAIPRLLDMGIEPFLLASTLELVIGQRLARKLAEGGRYSVTTNQNKIDQQYPGIGKFFPAKEMHLYEGVEDEDGDDSGAYAGRTALFEMIEVDDPMEEFIIGSPAAHEVHNQAVKSGFTSMFDDGVEKVKTGVTSLKELLRVIRPSKDYGEKNKKK